MNCAEAKCLRRATHWFLIQNLVVSCCPIHAGLLVKELNSGVPEAERGRVRLLRRTRGTPTSSS